MIMQREAAMELVRAVKDTDRDSGVTTAVHDSLQALDQLLQCNQGTGAKTQIQYFIILSPVKAN